MKKLLCFVLWHDWDHEVRREQKAFENSIAISLIRKCRHCDKQERAAEYEYSPNFWTERPVSVFYGKQEEEA